MSEEYDAVCGVSTSSTSSTGSFENVDIAIRCQSSVSPVTTEENVSKDLVSEGLTTNTDSGDKHCSQDQFYTAIHTGRAISNLVKFSAAMFVLPLLTMLTTYHYIFRDYFDLPPDVAALYAGLCGVAVVIVIAIVFVYVAYCEEEVDKEIKVNPKKSQ